MRRFSAWILLHRKKFLIASTVLSFFYFLWGVNSYKYSFVGDVWPFYTFARDTLYLHFSTNPFSFDGVFGINSNLASWYQAFFMALFGVNNFAWRLSNIILIVPMSYFFYKWLKLTFDWRIATVATILLQFSFFLSTFFKIGYINPQALALFIPTLYYAALSSEQPTKRNGFILGSLLGVSFYIYLGPIFPFLVWPYFLPFFKYKHKRKLLPFLATLIVTYGILLSFFLPSMSSVDGPQAKTVMNREFSDNEQIVTNIGNNFLVFYKDFNIIYTHFIPFPYLDIVSQGLALIGTIAAFGYAYIKKYRELLFVYLSTVVVLGITNPYAIPPTSRGMMLVIFGFIFAAIGLMILLKIKPFRGRIVVPLLGIIILLNIYTSQIAAFEKTGYTSMALIFKSIQDAHAVDQKQTYLLVSDRARVKTELNTYIPIMLQAYGLEAMQLNILSPERASCSDVAQKEILVLSYDTDAFAWMDKMSCEESYQRKVLTTNISYY